MFNARGEVGSLPQAAVTDGPMSVEMLTGNTTIDAEHEQLYAILKAARSVCLDASRFQNCAACSEVRRADCENQLVSLLGDLLSFILEHFKTEELFMRESLLIMVDRLLCETHMEDHAAISSRIERLVAALDSTRTVSLLRELDQILGRWVIGHVATHDMALVNWIEREDSALRSGF